MSDPPRKRWARLWSPHRKVWRTTLLEGKVPLIAATHRGQNTRWSLRSTESRFKVGSYLDSDRLVLISSEEVPGVFDAQNGGASFWRRLVASRGLVDSGFTGWPQRELVHRCDSFFFAVARTNVSVVAAKRQRRELYSRWTLVSVVAVRRQRRELFAPEAAPRRECRPEAPDLPAAARDRDSTKQGNNSNIM